MKYILTITCFILISTRGIGQACIAAGQTPTTAFPVCGTSTFSQTSVALCGGQIIPAAGCGAVTDINPYWYKFTCFQSGTLGFNITPHTNTDDYDWQLFDITNQDPNEVYNDPSLTVAFNWSGEGGATGASNAGNSLFVCDGFGQPLWSSMPTLIQGHVYILLVSHFTQTQSGYDLSFGGGSAVITDTTAPGLKYVDATCGGNVVRVKLNKKMKCGSVAMNGSDFFITPGNIGVVSATALNCQPSFDTDYVELTLNGFLSPGNYAVNVKTGNDGNTVLDHCNKPIPVNEKVDFTVYALEPTPMDSLSPLPCPASQLKLVFRKPILCSSVSVSDFSISGTSPVTITSAQASCPLSNEVTLTLSQPIYSTGSFTLTLQNGTDGNTLLDECSMQTPPGSTISFTTGDTVNANFTYNKLYGCGQDTIKFFHQGGNGLTWQWDLDDNNTSSQQNPRVIYPLLGLKYVELIVSNGVCSDSSFQQIMLDNFMKADFTAPADLCPNEPVQFTSTAQGNIKQHSWTFGDGGTSALASPTHIYSGQVSSVPYNVRYTVTDSLGCTSSVQKPFKVYSSCFLAVPNAFTPNRDGKNDFLYPLNAVKAEKLNFKIYNRWGQMVFHTTNWKNGWDGMINGSPQPAGVYIWFLTYVDRDTKEAREMKGTAVLIR